MKDHIRPLGVTREPMERRNDAADIISDGGESRQSARADHLPLHSSPRRPDSSPGEEAPADRIVRSDPPTMPTPRGHHKPTDDERLDSIGTAAEEMVWVLSGRDHRRSADLLEKLADSIHETSEHDRAAAKRRARGEPPPKSNLERAREILRGVHSTLCEGKAVPVSRVGDALRLLEEIGR